MERETVGKRAYPNEDGELWLSDGEYGRMPHDGAWIIRPPGQRSGTLTDHDITEHPDGTITVNPSILLTTYDNDCAVKWHGWLERGVWREI